MGLPKNNITRSIEMSPQSRTSTELEMWKHFSSSLPTNQNQTNAKTIYRVASYELAVELTILHKQVTLFKAIETVGQFCKKTQRTIGEWPTHSSYWKKRFDMSCSRHRVGYLKNNTAVLTDKPFCWRLAPSSSVDSFWSETNLVLWIAKIPARSRKGDQ